MERVIEIIIMNERIIRNMVNVEMEKNSKLRKKN